MPDQTTAPAAGRTAPDKTVFLLAEDLHPSTIASTIASAIASSIGLVRAVGATAIRSLAGVLSAQARALRAVHARLAALPKPRRSRVLA